MDLGYQRPSGAQPRKALPSRCLSGVPITRRAVVMAINAMRWIGRRIQLVDDLNSEKAA